ncbi:hypothetical protein E9993_22970, partial [Labilibacter sediminis]
MASKPQALAFLLFALSTLSFIINASHAADQPIRPSPVLTVYWGQNENEGTLREACATKNYEIVNLGFLNVFGNGRTPQLNFAGYCGDSSPCTKLAPEIRYCQNHNVKVFLSLGGAEGDYDLSSPQDAREVAQYLYNNFLNDQDGPLGRVSLDGIDFDIEIGSNRYYEDLVKALHEFSTEQRRIYLSAAPRCRYPDHHLDAAIKTGLFNYILGQFYNNPRCQYSKGNEQRLLNHFDMWARSVMPNNAVLLGLPAAPDAANSGFIPADVVKNQILPNIRNRPNYGGVMVWNRYYDRQTHFSRQIRDSLGPVLKSVAALADAMYECVTKTLYRFYPV